LVTPTSIVIQILAGQGGIYGDDNWSHTFHSILCFQYRCFSIFRHNEAPKYSTDYQYGRVTSHWLFLRDTAKKDAALAAQEVEETIAEDRDYCREISSINTTIN
jgi:hypothetical protein